MKTKFLAFIMCMLFMYSGTYMSAQVTAGLNEAAEKYATLQIKDVAIDRTNGPLNGATADKGGLLLPRVILQEKKELLPFATAADMASSEYANLKKLHTGLIVYNLVENDEKELCLGLNQWDGEQWNCFQNKLGNAIATIGQCDSVTFAGVYKDKTPLDMSNYMTIPLHVTKAGAYTITATVKDAETNTNDNGYFFTTTGVFMSTGYYFLTIPGAGTPIKYTPQGAPNPGDPVTVTFNGKEVVGANAGCQKYITVENTAVNPSFRMECVSTKVFGNYYMDKELTTNEYIEVTLRVDASSYPPGSLPARARLWTDEVNGIKFEGDAILNTSSMVVKLIGEGRPNTLNPIKLTIYSNSIQTTATCEVTVRPVIRKKTLVSIGTANSYGYGLSGSLHHAARMLGSQSSFPNTTNFGAATSTVPSEKHKYVYYEEKNTNSDYLQTIINTEKPDILFIGYPFYPNSSSAPSIATSLVNYVKAGGVLIALWEQDAGKNVTQEFFNQLFGISSVTSNRVQSNNSSSYDNGNVFRIESVDDEITNGPFGDVRGLQWGDDGANGLRVMGIPEEELIRYSSDVNLTTDNTSNIVDGASTFLRLKNYNVIFIGDGGFTAGQSNSGGDTSHGATQVFTISSDGKARPIPNTNYGGGTKFTVYNSIVFGNIMSWAMKQAEASPYNP